MTFGKYEKHYDITPRRDAYYRTPVWQWNRNPPRPVIGLRLVPNPSFYTPELRYIHKSVPRESPAALHFRVPLHRIPVNHTLSYATWSQTNIEPNKAFHPYGAQGAPRVNADVGHKNNRLPHVQWTLHIDNAKKSDHTVTLKTMGQSRTAENQMNSPTRRSTITRHKWREGER